MSKKPSKTKRAKKTKAKFPESSQLNQSGNSVDSQIGVAAEQPMHPSDIQHLLQLEREGLSYAWTADDQQIHLTFPQSTANTQHPPCDTPTSQPGPLFTPQAGPSTYPGPDPYLPAAHQYTTVFPDDDPRFGSSFFNPSPDRFYMTDNGSDNCGALMRHPGFGATLGEDFSSSQSHPDLPFDFDYAPSALRLRPDPEVFSQDVSDSLHSRTVRVIPRASPYPVERVARPGEAIPGERFSIASAKLPVIRPVGQSTRDVARNLSRVRLPAVQPATSSTYSDDRTTTSGHHNPIPGPPRRALLPATIESIRINARNNFKRALFTETLLPPPKKAADLIRAALFDAAREHLGDGVNDWLEREVVQESKRLKDIANNIRNDFKNSARLLTIPLYQLTLPIYIRSQEVAFRQSQIASLLSGPGFSYLDEIRTVDGVDVTVPFGHPAIVQLVVHLLWKENGYAKYLPENTNINVVMAFAGTIVHWVLQDHASNLCFQSEFNLSQDLPTYTQLVQRIEGLTGNESHAYNVLVQDILARGAEIRGLAE